MIIRLLPTYIYFFIEAQNAQHFSLECTKVKLLILNNFVTNECVLCVFVCRFGISFAYVIKGIESKLI